MQAVDFLRAEHELHERQGEQGFDFGDPPVVAQCVAHPAPLLIDLPEFPGWLAVRRGPKLAGMFDSRLHIVNQWRILRLTAPRALSRALAATLFPPRCCLCGFRGASLDLDLCAYCHADLPWATQTPGTTVALRYETPVDDLVRELKYHGVIAHARVLGALLAQVVGERAARLPAFLIPVPLHRARWRERGFNQAAAVARYAGRLLGVPVARHVVVRVRDTPSQTTLDVNARRGNLRAAFAITGERARRRLSAVRHVAIVDDVITTGSTVNEMRRVLLDAGLKEVEVWAIARAAPMARNGD
jgi:ComF family protein